MLALAEEAEEIRRFAAFNWTLCEMTVTTSAGVELDDTYTFDDAATLAQKLTVHIDNGSTPNRNRC